MTVISYLIGGSLYPADVGYVVRREAPTLELEVGAYFKADFPIAAHNDTGYAFRCYCGSFDFTLRPDGAYCTACGTYAKGWFD
jgi:hypothetical protein